MDHLSKNQTLIDILIGRSINQPEKIAYIFLENGEKESVSLSYQELDQKAKNIANILQKYQGERALLLYPSGLEFIIAFFGCLYAGVIPIPLYPPRKNNYKLSRLLSIINNSQAKIALTINSILQNIEEKWQEETKINQLKLIATDTITFNNNNFLPQSILPENLAFLQYTSGSTSLPKGVMITHQNIIDNQKIISKAFNHNEESMGVGWLPLFHDMGLIGHILQPLYVGFPSILMSPTSFLQKPIRWLQAISKYGVTTTGCSNFGYDYCVEKIKTEDLKNIDLSSWKLAYNGAEPIRAKTLKNFSKKFTQYGFNQKAFYPCYGLAENTLFTTGINHNQNLSIKTINHKFLSENLITNGELNSSDSQDLVSCGQSFLDTKVITVDPDSLSECKNEKVGEIWISGNSVAKGYWNNEELTNKTFKVSLNNSQETFLRTGDLGFLSKGELFITGRLKDLIIIRGKNYYPQDIELTIEDSHPALKKYCVCAFATNINGKESLIIVSEVKRTFLRKLNQDEIFESILVSIATEYQLDIEDILLLKPATIPKTSSGKIQRYACKKGFLDNSLNIVAQWNKNNQKNLENYQANSLENNLSIKDTKVTEIETWLVNKISEILDINPEIIDIKQPLAIYGLSSVKAINIITEIEEDLDISLSQDFLFEYPNIQSITQHIIQNKNTYSLYKQSNKKSFMTEEELNSIPSEYYLIESSKEYKELQERKEKISTLGITNPFFKSQNGIAQDIISINNKILINYATYNYLGMCGDSIVIEATKQALNTYGTSASASRLISGEKKIHRELEQGIANFIGVEDSIVYVGGHSTNATTIGHLFGKNDLILYDELSHNSILEGAFSSGAKLISFTHNNYEKLVDFLKKNRHKYQKILIVIEGVYSTDGDIPNLPEFIKIKQKYKAFLMVDEAHSIGVLGASGKGITEHYKINPNLVDILMGTLSKSFASCGGYIAGSKALVEYLKYTSPGFVYSVGISPPNAASALASIQLLQQESQRVLKLKKQAQLFLDLAKEKNFNTGLSKNSAVIPIIVGEDLQAIQLSENMFNRGINAPFMIYPSVPQNEARLRFFISCLHTDEQIRKTINILEEELNKLKVY